MQRYLGPHTSDITAEEHSPRTFPKNIPEEHTHVLSCPYGHYSPGAGELQDSTPPHVAPPCAPRPKKQHAHGKNFSFVVFPARTTEPAAVLALRQMSCPSRSGEWPAWFSFWFSGCWRALATCGTAWAGFVVFFRPSRGGLPAIWRQVEKTTTGMCNSPSSSSSSSSR